LGEKSTALVKSPFWTQYGAELSNYYY